MGTVFHYLGIIGVYHFTDKDYPMHRKPECLYITGMVGQLLYFPGAFMSANDE